MKSYVIDQNVMRKPMLAALIAAEPDSSFIVPDVALLEMSKGQNWEGTMRPSLAAFAGANDRIYVSLSIGEALKRERNFLNATTVQDLITDEFTSFVRSLIKELSSGRPAMSMELIRANFPQAFTHWQTADLNADSAKARVIELVHLFKKGLKKEVIKALRNHSYPQYRLALIAAQAEQFVLNHIPPKVIAPAAAYKFLSYQPMTFRYTVLLTRHALDWAIEGGLDSLPTERELNNLLDIEYALTASYFDDLVTEDGGARSAFSDLKEILAMSPETVAAVMKGTLQEILADPKF
ncbi:hypothetical protein ACO0K3_04765 [Undibacterium sp. Rencai35W]|uniref:hypothetical protein n=1 Tax=Undibacterium sp. Rencai35W TaxID=3413046 RepID=UPI003BF2DB85